MVYLLALTLVAWLVLACVWARENSRVSLAVTFVGLAVVATAVVALWLPASAVPREWVTVLQESGGHDNILRAFGQREHAGPVYVDWTLWWVRDGDIRALVRANILLTFFQALLLAAYANVALGGRLGGADAGILFLISPPGLHMALSSSPAALLGVLWWLAVLPVAAMAPGAGIAAAQNALSLATLTLVGVSAAMIRAEMLVPTVLALVSMTIRAQVGDEVMRAAGLRAWGRVTDRVITAARAWWFPYVVVVVLSLLHATRWFGSYRLGTVVWMLNPVGPELISATLYLISVFPLVVVVLAVIGSVGFFRRWYATGLVVVSLTALMRGYQSASNSARFEMFRYLLFVVPMIALHAVEGWRLIRERVAQASDSRAAHGLVHAVLLVLLVTPAPAGMQAFLALDDRETPVADTFPPTLSTVQQQEVREVLVALDRWPTCVMLSRVLMETGSGAGESATGTWRWVAFGAHDHPRLLSTDGTPTELAAAYFPNRCVLYFRGQDCNRLDAPAACEAEIEGREPLSARLVIGGQYNEPRETGRVRGETTLGVWAIDGVTVPPPGT